MLIFSRIIFVLLILLSGISIRAEIVEPWFCGDQICEAFTGETPESCPADCFTEPVITEAWIDAGPYQPIPSHGDLWMASWADDGTPDGRLVMTWGDGCGPGVSWGEPECDEFVWSTDVTDAGFFMVTGTVPEIDCVREAGECFTYRSVPDNISGYPHTPDDDKPGGILALDGTIYLSVMSPQCFVEEGYIVTSTDWGHTWQIVPGTPWTMENPRSPNSKFRVLMFFQMGKNYSFNTDGYVYAFGIGWGWSWEFAGDEEVYLCRVPRNQVANYDAYEYLSGFEQSLPVWSDTENPAIPVPGINFSSVFNIVYHPYIQRFLCLTDYALFESPNPWGPWIMSAKVLNWDSNADYWGAYSTTLFPKDMGPDYIFFTTAGRTENVTYSMNVSRLHLELNADPKSLTPKPWSPVPIDFPDSITPVSQKKTPSRQEEHQLTLDRPDSIHLFPGCELTIQDAVDRISDNGEIILASGTYSGPGNTDVIISRPVRISGSSPVGSCIIDGSRSNAGMYIREVGEPGVHLENLVFEECYRRSPGGALTVIFSKVELVNVSLIRCGSPLFGGGLAMYESDIDWIGGQVMKCYTQYWGGGIYSIWQGHLNCMGVNFLENSCYVYGGAVYDTEAHSLFSDCRFYGNQARYGGAVCCHQSCTMKYENCFFETNSALMMGGAINYLISIWFRCEANAFECFNSTFHENISGVGEYTGMGGAIFSAYSPDQTLVRDSIFWNNSSDIGQQIAFDGTGFIDFQHSLVEGGLEGIYRNGIYNWVNWGNGMLAADPLFASGPSGNCYLSRTSTGHPVTSPAIDAGHASAASIAYGIPGYPAYHPGNLTTSINQIPDNGQVDMGAHYRLIQPLPISNGIVSILTLLILSIYIHGRRSR